MGYNEPKNVNFSDRLYEAEMTTYISYEMSSKSEKMIWASKNSIRIWNSRHKIHKRNGATRGNRLCR